MVTADKVFGVLIADGKHCPGETVVLLGGGIGAFAATNRLGRWLDRRHRVILVSRDPAASYLWMMSGKSRPSQVTRSLPMLKHRGTEVVIGDIESIDPASPAVAMHVPPRLPLVGASDGLPSGWSP